jgi:acetyl esterase/lipase
MKLAFVCRCPVWSVLALASATHLIPALASPRQRLAAAGIELREGIVFRSDDGRRTALDLYLPIATASDPAPAPRGAVLAIHGGSWRGGSITSSRSSPDGTFAQLAQNGLVVAVVDYRLARPGAPSWPAVVGDLRAAVRWLRSHSNELAIDPNRIAALGQSSGAHLAMLLGTLPDEQIDGVSARVSPVISFYGPSDLADLASSRQLAHEPAAIFLGVDPTTAAGAGAAREASPIERVTQSRAPMLLIHGSADAWVDPGQSVRMAKALERAHIAHRLIIVEGARHGFEARVRAPAVRDLMPDLLAFLENVWNGSDHANQTRPPERE